MPVSHDAAGLSNTAAEGERNRVGLLEMLGRLADPRSRQGRRHELVFVLACAVVATLAGATNYRQLASQVADLPQSLLAELGARWNWFRRRFGWPSEATLRRVLQRIDAAELDRLVGAWLYARAWRDADGLLVIAVDGKVLRGAWTDANDQVTLFSAMIHARAVTIAQLKVPDGTNEITQVEELLQDIADQQDRQVIITLDAAHTQRDTARYIAGERGFDYIMTAKGNHCAARRLVVYPTQLGGIVERSLGPMAYLEPKGKGNSSLPGNRRLGPGVWDDAPGDPCDMAKARLPEPQSSADALYIHRKDACNRCQSCVVRVGSATHSSRRGAMPSEGI